MAEESRAKPSFDWWWVLGLFLIVGVLIAAIIVNDNYSHNSTTENISDSINIDNGDIKINWERYPSYDVELTDTYTIASSGTYNIYGELTDGAIIVKAGADADVKVVLNDVTIKNSSGPAIACYTADDLVIELNGENYLEDGSKYASNWDTDVTGVIYSKSDLSFMGDGELVLKANYADGIVGKDDLTFRGGDYDIVSADDGIRGKDSVHIEKGTFAIKSTGDAIKSTNETTSTKGFVLIEDGDFEIATSDDGIHANNRLIVDGGTINITKSYEGLEAQKISINGGKISIMANDDGMNAGGGADESANNKPGKNPFDADENCEISINGGEIYVNAAGDGIDSNGWLYINGGSVIVDGPTNNGNGALDAGAGIVQTGGSLIAVGASGMAEAPGSSSSVYNASIYLYSSQKKGTKIEIKNSAGDTIISHVSAKSFSHITVGTKDFEKDQSYILYLDDEKTESFTITNITTMVGNSPKNYQVMGPDPRRM